VRSPGNELVIMAAKSPGKDSPLAEFLENQENFEKYFFAQAFQTPAAVSRRHNLSLGECAIFRVLRICNSFFLSPLKVITE
jgi:hypothetical protein